MKVLASMGPRVSSEIQDASSAKRLEASAAMSQKAIVVTPMTVFVKFEP